MHRTGVGIFRAPVLLVAVFVLGTGLLLWPTISRAASINVTTTADGALGSNTGQCTLRGAIQTAYTHVAVDSCTVGSGNDTIHLSAGTYLISRAGLDDLNALGDFDVRSVVSVVGAGSTLTTINAQSNDRVFDIHGVTFDLEGVRLINGHDTAGYGGGAIYAEDAGPEANPGLSMQDVKISGSTTTTSGGGIYIEDAVTASLSGLYVTGNNAGVDGGGISNNGLTYLDDSTISGNTSSSNGGGLSNVFYQTYPGYLFVTSSTISGNAATSNGGGIYTVPSSYLDVDRMTLASNTATSGAGIYVQGVDTVYIGSSILANNVPDDCHGQPATLQYSILKNGSGCTLPSAYGTTVGADPLLSVLAASGTGLPIHAIPSNSVAIDHGDPTCTTPDENGLDPEKTTLNASAACDAGAYEYDAFPTIAEVTAVPYWATTSPQYTLNSTESGTLNTSSGCAVVPASATISAGNNTITFSSLSQGFHLCNLSVTDGTGKTSNTLVLSSFIVDTISPSATVTVPVPAVSGSPSITFTASESGNLSVTGGCAISSASFIAGSNTVNLSASGPGSHTNCALRLSDFAGNVTMLSINAFTYYFGTPHIDLQGQKTVHVSYGTTYADAGVLAYDGLDGDISNQVTVTYGGDTPVNTLQVGTYQISYHVTNSTGTHDSSYVTRTVVVEPSMTTLSLKKGSLAIKNLQGQNTVLTPFGKSFNGSVLARKMTFSPTTVTYLFVMTSPAKKWQAVAYNANGAKIKNVFSLSSSVTAKGLNADIAIDQVGDVVVLALASKSSTNVPYVYTINGNTISKASMVDKTKTKVLSGDVLVKLLPVTNDRLGVVTALAGAKKQQVRVWLAGIGNYGASSLYNVLKIKLSGRILSLIPPVLSDPSFSPSTDGSVRVSWTVDKNADGLVNWGVSSVYGSSLGDNTISKTHSITITGNGSNTYHFSARSCVPKTWTEIACMSTPDVIYGSL